MAKTVINPSELGKQLVPQTKVVDDEGREIVRPDVLQAVVQLATLGQLTRIRRSLEKEEFEGELDPRTLGATDVTQCLELDQYPNVPWATATAFNDGPNRVFIAINGLAKPVTLNLNEGMSLDFTKADMRIKSVYYWCGPGDTASVRAVGKY